MNNSYYRLFQEFKEHIRKKGMTITATLWEEGTEMSEYCCYEVKLSHGNFSVILVRLDIYTNTFRIYKPAFN